MEAGPQVHAKGLEGHTETDKGPLKLIHSDMVSILHTQGTGTRSVDMATVDWQRKAWRGLVRKLL